MPDRTISLLSYVAGALVCAYVALVVVTVTYATVQTDLALSVRDTESAISTVETDYYAQVSRLSATDPSSMQLQKPRVVSYATLLQAPSLTLR